MPLSSRLRVLYEGIPRTASTPRTQFPLWPFLSDMQPSTGAKYKCMHRDCTSAQSAPTGAPPLDQRYWRERHGWQPAP